MKRSWSYHLDGEPVPSQRARHSKTSHHVYNPQRALQHILASHLMQQHDGQPLFEGPLEMIITWYMPIPKSITPRRRELLVAKYHHIKPDVDNLERLLLNACNGVIFKDDCQISRIVKQKVYDHEPRTVFKITEL
jgi:Holliday junction resolvase RusA-like endonuclease